MFYVFPHSIPVSSLMGTKALRPPLHSLEINCVKTFELCNQTFLVIGSEDTKIKIFQMDEKLTRKCCVATLNTHISSVKCLAVVVPKTADGSVYVVSAGSRAQVKITVLGVYMSDQVLKRFKAHYFCTQYCNKKIKIHFSSIIFSLCELKIFIFGHLCMLIET